MDASADSEISWAEYETLLGEMKERGLFGRTYWHYGLCAAFAVLGIAASLYIVTLTDNALIQFCNAIFFGFCSVQIGMIGHDLSHGEVFKSPGVNRFVSSAVWGILGGLSEYHWFNKHNRHHTSPNHIGHDPDVDIPFMFTEKQVAAKSAFLRKWVLPYQHYFFWISFVFLYPWNIFLGMRSILSNLSPRTVTEIFLMVIHFAVLFFILFAYLPWHIALLFLGTAFIALGIYIGFAFAPNHKGRDELAQNETFLWTHQIKLTRNIYPSRLVFFLLGGLNFQIEHHLFPTMSRLKYWNARPFIQEFCDAKGLSYHQTSWIGSLVEMHTSLKREALARRNDR